jgi:Domain of Unknown Function (DUF1206)
VSVLGFSAMTMKPGNDIAPWIERMARVGYTAKGILYMTIGYLAAEAAFGPGGGVTDTRGALRAVKSASLGQALLLVIAAGLLGYAAWRLVEAVIDPERRGTKPKAILMRAGYAGRGVFHAGLGLTAIRLALGYGSGSGGGQAPHWTARAFRVPGGELLVWLAAAWIAGYGLYQFYRAWSPQMRKHLGLAELPQGLRRWVLGVSRFGIAARGVVFCLIGFFLGHAALRHDPAQAGGVRESLSTLANTGRWPFAVVAFGLIAYGVFQLVNARYRRIRVSQ